MRYRNAEDRLNPLVPEGTDDTTLGGYAAVHGRAAAFEGADRQPYTVAIEAERNEDGDEPWGAYLVFLRWAETGSAIMGHVTTDDLARGATEAEARKRIEAIPLSRAREILDQTIADRDTASD